MENHDMKVDDKLQTNDSKNNQIVEYKTEDDEVFTSLKLLIKRDLKHQNISREIYQVQTEKNNKTSDLIYLGKYNNTPVENILSFTHGEYQCDLISFAMDNEEITLQNKEDQSLLMIGYLIGRDNKIIGALEYVFRPNNFVALKKQKRSIYKIDGKFEIKLTTKKNGIYNNEIIKEYKEYSGREESVYILTSLLIEENVIKKIEERT